MLPLLQGILLADLLLLAFILKKLLCGRQGQQSSAKNAQTKHKTQKQQRNFMHKTLLLIVDVNNVRGAAKFGRDVDDTCAAILQWIQSKPPGMSFLLAVDHGPKAATFRVGTRTLISFAGPRLDADDVIVCSSFYCAQKYRKVKIHTSDALLRRRCLRAVRKAASIKDGRELVSFEHREALSDLPAATIDAEANCHEQNILLGAPDKRLTSRAAEAVRGRRRERSGKKIELTFMREQQAKTLFERLEASVTSHDRCVQRFDCSCETRPGASNVTSVGQFGSGAILTPSEEAAHFLSEHASLLGDVGELFTLHRKLKKDMENFSEQKLR